MALTQDDVRQAFTTAGVGTTEFADPNAIFKFRNQTYDPVKEAFLLGDFAEWFDFLLVGWNLKWEDYFKCDAFAQNFAGLMRVSYDRWAVTQPAGVPQGPAVFECWGGNFPTVNGNHAVIAAIVEGNLPVWIEPQPRAAVKLYPMTKENCQGVYLLI